MHLLELPLAPQIPSTAPPPVPVQWVTLFSLQQESQTSVFVQSREEPKKCSSRGHTESQPLPSELLLSKMLTWSSDLAAKELNCTSGLSVGSFLAFLVLGAGTTHSCCPAPHRESLMNFSRSEQARIFLSRSWLSRKWKGAVTASSNTPQKWHSKNVYILYIIHTYICIHFSKVKISEGILANQPSLTMASSGYEGRGGPHQPAP